MHRKNIEKIIESGTLMQMYDLKEILVCAIDDMKTLDKNKYKEYEMCIHRIIYGNHLGKELATC